MRADRRWAASLSIAAGFTVSDTKTDDRKGNGFAKTVRPAKADDALRAYFAKRSDRVQDWFNVIKPASRPLSALRDELGSLLGHDLAALR